MSQTRAESDKPLITDDEIIRLYKEGLSQNDIIRLYQIPVWHSRRVLQAAGFDTKTYRNIHPIVKETVFELAVRGANYFDIERICDISYDVIRESIADQKCQGMSRRNRKAFSQMGEELKSGISFDRSEFAAQYNSGASFCKITIDMELSLEQRIAIFVEFQNNEFHEADPAQHRKGLYEKIRKDAESGLSITTIARRHIISKSVVRKALAE